MTPGSEIMLLYFKCKQLHPYLWMHGRWDGEGVAEGEGELHHEQKGVGVFHL